MFNLNLFRNLKNFKLKADLNLLVSKIMNIFKHAKLFSKPKWKY